MKIKVNNRLIEKIYKYLYLIRRTEEEVSRIYPTDKIKSPVHLSIGQEAVSVGVCLTLKPKDVVFGTYRSHALYLAKDGDLRRMIAELYGKIDGCAAGKGGSMHLIDINKGIMGTSAIVATTIPQSVGFAYSLKYRRSSSVVVSFFGDGAVDEGVFHESMNFAALKKLPILFVCENNRYAIHSHQRARHSSLDVAKRAMSYGITASSINDQDIFKIFETSKIFIAKIRSGKGPAFLECLTSRWKEHVGPQDDFHLGYRSVEEVERWKKKDQLRRVGAFLTSAVKGKIEEEIKLKIEDAVNFAEKSSFPLPEMLKKGVFL